MGCQRASAKRHAGSPPPAEETRRAVPRSRHRARRLIPAHHGPNLVENRSAPRYAASAQRNHDPEDVMLVQLVMLASLSAAGQADAAKIPPPTGDAIVPEGAKL